jgi:hypothetical protein
MSEVRRKILRFLADCRLEAGNCIPEKPFRFKFYPSLTPPQQRQVEEVLGELVEGGVLKYKLPVVNPVTLSSLLLTEAGEDLIYAESSEPELSSGSTAAQIDRTSVVQHITNNFHGAASAQFGDHNSQIINNYFSELSGKIESSEATFEEKAEAKSLLMKVSEHPLLSRIISGIGVAAIRIQLGI